MKDSIAKLRAAADARPFERTVDIELRVAAAIAELAEDFAAESERLTRELRAAIASLNEAGKFLIDFAKASPTPTPQPRPVSPTARQSGGSGSSIS